MSAFQTYSADPVPPTPPLAPLANPFSSLAAIGLITQILAMAASKWLPENMRNNFVDFGLQAYQWVIGPGIILLGHWWQTVKAKNNIAALKAVQRDYIGRYNAIARVLASQPGSKTASGLSTSIAGKLDLKSDSTCTTGRCGPRRPLGVINTYALCSAALLAVLTAIMLVTVPGCNLFTPKATTQSASSALVMQAEQSLQAATDTINVFLQIDNDNRALFEKDLPAVHKTAEDLRREAPAAINAALAAIQLYQSVQSADNAATVNQTVVLLENLAIIARSDIGQAETTGVATAKYVHR